MISFIIHLLLINFKKKRYPDLPGPMSKSNVEQVEQVVITFWAKSH